MRPLKPRNRASSSYPEPGRAPPAAAGRGEAAGVGGAGTVPGVGEGRPAGRGCAARGKPISQIIGLDPTVLPRYPAFIRLPDWGRGAGRRRRGSNYGSRSPVAGRWRRAGPGRARPGVGVRGGRAGGARDRARGSPGRPIGVGGRVRLGPGRPSPRAAPPPGPAQLPHCLLWRLALPPSRPPPARRPPARSFLPSSRKKEEPVCGDE